MAEEHYRKLERMYQSAPIQQLYPGTEIQIANKMAVITLPVRQAYHHAAHAVHGSVYFRLVDDAAYFAASSMVDDVFILTKHMEIELRRPITEGTLRCVGEVKTNDNDTIVANSVLYTAEGKEAAFGMGTFVKGTTALSEQIGYQ